MNESSAEEQPTPAQLRALKRAALRGLGRWSLEPMELDRIADLAVGEHVHAGRPTGDTSEADQVAARAQDIALEAGHVAPLPSATRVEFSWDVELAELPGFDVRRAITILQERLGSEEDQARRQGVQEALNYLVFAAGTRETRKPEWLDALKDLPAILDKLRAAFERAARALDELASERYAALSSHRDPPPEWLRQVEIAQGVVQGLRALGRPEACEAIEDALDVSRAPAGRPALDNLAHAEAILSGRLRGEILLSEEGGLRWGEIAELDLDGQGIDNEQGESFEVEGAKRVQKRVDRYLERLEQATGRNPAQKT